MNLPGWENRNNSFFAREQEIKLLNMATDGLLKGYRQNLVFLGKESVGKSSLLLHFLKNLTENSVIPIYLDIKRLSFTELVDKFIGMMLYYYFKSTGQNVENNLDFLIKEAGTRLPAISAKIRDIYSYLDQGEEDKAYPELFGLINYFSQEANRFCLIIIDGFENLDEYNLKKPFSILGENIMLQRNALYVLAGNSFQKSRDILSNKLSLLFGKFRVVQLLPFTQEEAKDYIDKRCEGIDIRDSLKNFVVALSAGVPFYLELITDAFIAHCRKNEISNISSETLASIISELLFAKTSVLNQYFLRTVETSVDGSSKRMAMRILQAMVKNNKISEIATSAGCTRKEVIKIISRLIDKGKLERNGTLYAIEDELFKVWIELGAEKRAHTFDIAFEHSAGRFRQHLKKKIDAFIDDAYNIVDNKITSLVAAFNNEKITIGERTHIIPVFKHIVKDTSGTPGGALLTAHGSQMWVFSLCKNLIEEKDVVAFCEKCRQNKTHKINRKVLISIKGITPEANLLAKQEQMWIWPLDRLNSLLNLYGKQGIVAI